MVIPADAEMMKLALPMTCISHSGSVSSGSAGWVTRPSQSGGRSRTETMRPQCFLDPDVPECLAWTLHSGQAVLCELFGQ